MNIVILASGRGERFRRAGYQEPKFLIKFNGIPLYKHVITNYQLEDTRIHLVINKDHRSLVDEHPNISLVPIVQTRGPTLSLMQGLSSVSTDPYAPLIVLDCDCWLTKPLIDLVPRNFDHDSYVVDAKYETNAHHFTRAIVNENGEFKYFKATPGPSVNPGVYMFRSVHSFAANYAWWKENIRTEQEPTFVSMFDTMPSMVGVVRTNCKFISVGTPEELEYHSGLTNR